MASQTGTIRMSHFPLTSFRRQYIVAPAVYIKMGSNYRRGVIVTLLLFHSTLIIASGREEIPEGVPVVEDYRGRQVAVVDASRIVPIGGAVTEILFAIGAGPQVVGIDISATYPPEATELPVVGYQRRITAEGVLSVNPTLVIATTEAEPIASFRLIRDADVTVLIIPEEFSVEGTHDKIRRIGMAVGREAEAQSLTDRIDREIEAAAALADRADTRQRVLFIYARGDSVLLAAGRGTQAAAMLAMAGAVNAGESFRGFRTLSAEAVAAANPDIVLMMTGGLESVGGVEGALALPGVALTPAGRDRKVIHFEDHYLLGFGPRFGLAARDLVLAFHPELRS